MKGSLLLLVVAAFALVPAAASAQYTLADDANSVNVGHGGQSRIAVEYTSFCFALFACPTTQSVGSSNGVTFDDNSVICNDASGGELTRFACTKRPNTQVAGTNGNDSVNGSCLGTNSGLIFNGLGGNDEVSAGSCAGGAVDMGPGNDRAASGGTVNGGPGTDTVRGGPGNDVLDGGDGRDTVDGQAGTDTVRGGTGRDILVPGLGSGDVVEGGTDTDSGSYEDRDQPVAASLDNQANDGIAGENDLIASDVENLIGGAGDDTLIGDANPNDIDGGDGGDVIDGLGGPDFVDGGPGNDRITARDGAQDRVICGDGNDLAVTDEFDTVVACETVQASRELMPDVDADGVPAPADCDDRDARRRPGFTDKPGNDLDEDCTGGDAPFARVLSPVQSTFSTRGRRTRVLRLRVLAVPEGGTVELRCKPSRRRGCFRGVKRFRAPRGDELLNIRRPVRRSRLRNGAKLEVRVLDADSIGKVVEFTMRTRKLPRSRTRCLEPGKRSPGRCPRL
jgi:RTX calcium-binding nonapeptide repeat (4 copies)